MISNADRVVLQLYLPRNAFFETKEFDRCVHVHVHVARKFVFVEGEEKGEVNENAILLSFTQPIALVNYMIVLSKPGKFPSGKTEIPFEMEVSPKQFKKLFETYHGVYINITVSASHFSFSSLLFMARIIVLLLQYCLKVEMKRSVFAKDLTKSTEFLLEYQASQFAFLSKINLCALLTSTNYFI